MDSKDEVENQKGICIECKVRHQDLSPKTLYICPLCNREFCIHHLDTKLAFFSARFKIADMIEDKEYRQMVENDFYREDAHPCVPYTKKRIKELEYENHEYAVFLKNLMDKAKAHKENQIESPIIPKIKHEIPSENLTNIPSSRRWYSGRYLFSGFFLWAIVDYFIIKMVLPQFIAAPDKKVWLENYLWFLQNKTIFAFSQIWFIIMIILVFSYIMSRIHKKFQR